MCLTNVSTRAQVSQLQNAHTAIFMRLYAVYEKGALIISDNSLVIKKDLKEVLMDSLVI